MQMETGGEPVVVDFFVAELDACFDAELGRLERLMGPDEALTRLRRFVRAMPGPGLVPLPGMVYGMAVMAQALCGE